MAQLYAACRNGGALVVKTVPLTAQLEAAIDPYFEAQEIAFMDGIQDEVPFTGDWNPDPDEVLLLQGLADAQTLLDAANLNAVALPPIDVNHFQNECIKSIFAAVGPAGNRRLLLQGFQAHQFLTNKFTVMFDHNVFRRVTEPSFSLDRQLVGIIDAQGDLRFKSYHLIRRIFEVGMVFRNATNAEVNAFAAHPSLHIADPAAFLADADEGTRKSIHALTATNVLGNNPVAAIEGQAQAIGFPLNVANGRITMPATRRDKKALLGFLLSKVYRGALDPRLFITNSTRPL
jgi:hypothetical protein